MINKVSIIGLGYIGLPTALMFASKGISVVGVDINKDLINSLRNKELTFEENGMDELFNIAFEKNLEFTTEYKESEIYIVAVPTPYIRETKKVDVTYIVNAVEKILTICDKGSIICIESTISPGTINNCIIPIIEKNNFILGKDIYIAHVPERIIPGNMIYELENNSRTIGCDDLVIGEKIKRLYSVFCKGDMIITDIRSAEMSKVVENTFRDINIAFANELARICRYDNMDVYEIIKIANMHPRVNILQPGPGVGGHCISVDPWFLVGDYPEIAKLIYEARKVNDFMPKFVLERLNNIMKEKNIVDISRVGLYGLTYKENIDDIRESPTIQLLEYMDSDSIKKIKLYDPYIDEIIFDNQYTNFEKFLENIDLVVVMVSHNHIKDRENMLNNKVVLDTKNIFKSNFVYKL